MDENENLAPDVDAMDDAAFDAFKTEIRKEPAPVAETTEKPASEAVTAKVEASEDDDDHGDEPNKAEVVPHGQFHRERERRKAAEAAQQKTQADYAKLLERTQALLMPKEEPKPTPVMPEWSENPIEAGDWTQKQVLELKQRLDKEEQDRTEQAQERDFWQRTIQTANDQFVEAEKADPTIRDAYNALKASYIAELKALGHTPQAADQELNRIEAQGIRYAVEAGIPVGDYVRNLAQARGWQPKPVVNNDLSDAEKLAKREETRLASQSLGKSGGAVTNTSMPSPEELLEMDDAEFDAFKKRHGGSIQAAFAN